MKRQQRIQIGSVLLACAMILILLTPAAAARAAGSLKLNYSKLTLVCGNTSKLMITEGDTSEWYRNGSITSSNPNVVVAEDVGYLFLRAVGVGKATVTVKCGNQTAKCEVTVKASGCTLSQKEITIYQGRSTTVKLKHKKKAERYIFRIVGEREDYYMYQKLKITRQSDGEYLIEAKTPGEYVVDFSVLADDGKEYSARGKITVLPCGVKEMPLVLANGQEKKLTVENATLLSCTVKRSFIWDPKDPADEEWTVTSSNAEITVDNEGNVCAYAPGKAELTVTYLTAYGETLTKTFNVYVTQPRYVPFEGSLWVGNTYWPNLKGIQINYSDIKVTSSNKNVIQFDGLFVVPKKAGTAQLTFRVDGHTFKQKVKVIDPKIPDVMVLEAGKKKKMALSGVEGCKVTYKSSDKSVATISKTGRITAKKAGSTRITVNVDGKDKVCSLTVGKGKGVTAVQKAYEVLGAAYSQSKRMQEGYYDCSSLVWRAYKAAGVKLCGLDYAPTAADLAKKLEAQGKVIAYEYISPSKLKPGDIIFYGGYDNGRYKGIYHVSMYLGDSYYDWDGEWYNDGAIIHASACVQISSYGVHSAENIVMIARPFP